jgi:hypothetical protein
MIHPYVPTRIAAILAIICVLAHGLLFGLLHFMEPQLSPSGSIISDYKYTASAWLATLSFLFFATVWASLSIALAQVPRSRLILAGRILFVLAFIFILAGNMFPSSLDPRSGTLLSNLQNILARPGLFMGVVLVSAGLSGKTGWKSIARILLVMSIVAFILLIVTITVLLPRQLGGIGQRLVFLLLYLWVLLISYKILKINTASDP